MGLTRHPRDTQYLTPPQLTDPQAPSGINVIPPREAETRARVAGGGRSWSSERAQLEPLDAGDILFLELGVATMGVFALGKCVERCTGDLWFMEGGLTLNKS